MGLAAKIPSRTWQELRGVVRERDSWRCRECGRAGRLEVHHKIPLKDGGSNALENLLTLCVGCHKAAHKRPVSTERAEWDRLAAQL